MVNFQWYKTAWQQQLVHVAVLGHLQLEMYNIRLVFVSFFFANHNGFKAKRILICNFAKSSMSTSNINFMVDPLLKIYKGISVLFIKLLGNNIS